MAKLVDLTKEGSAPRGLCLVLTHDELGKLGLDDSPDIGDYVHATILGKVTSASKKVADNFDVEYEGAEKEGQHVVRIEVEIVAMGLEDESHEDVGADAPGSKIGSALYGDD